jgi:hypothetical protein
MHWEALNVFVNDGALPIDNNQVERLMKRIAVGRKNWLFIGSLRAGVRNASLMSLVASALRQDLDVAMYLESVITHMLRGTAKTEELLPDRWKAAHPARRCESTASKSGSIRPTRPFCKQQDGASAPSYGRANSKAKGSCSQGNSRGLLEPYAQSVLRGRCESVGHRLIPPFRPAGPRTSPVVALRLPPANCLDPSGIRCPGRP